MWFYFPVYCTLQGIICQRTHDIYCSEAQPRSIFMCPRTNNPLQCTVDWEIKLLVHTQSCIPIGPELDVIIQGEIMPQIRRYIPVKCPACEALTCITKMCYPIAAIRITSIGQYRDIFPSSRPIEIEDFRQMCTNPLQCTVHWGIKPHQLLSFPPQITGSMASNTH